MREVISLNGKTDTRLGVLLLGQPRQLGTLTEHLADLICVYSRPSWLPNRKFVLGGEY